MATTDYRLFKPPYDLDRFRLESMSGENNIWGVPLNDYPDLTLSGVVFPSWQRFMFNILGPVVTVVGYELCDPNVEKTIQQVFDTFEKYSGGICYAPPLEG